MTEMVCNHRHEVECSYLSPTTGEPVVFKVCDPCASEIWSRMAQPLRETFSIEPLMEP